MMLQYVSHKNYSYKIIFF